MFFVGEIWFFGYKEKEDKLVKMFRFKKKMFLGFELVVKIKLVVVEIFEGVIFGFDWIFIRGYIYMYKCFFNFEEIDLILFKENG